MTVTAKDFIDGKEILFVGFSRDGKCFARGVYEDFVKAGFRVYPVNTRNFTDGGVRVFGAVKDVPNAPKDAYVALSAENAKKAVAELAEAGVKRIWFQGPETADAAVLDLCEKAGIDTFVGCAKMYLSDGFIHRLHGFFAGAKR